MENKIDVTTSLDNLLGLGCFAPFNISSHILNRDSGRYILNLFKGLASDISMIIEVLEDGTIKTRTLELELRGFVETTMHRENMTYTKVANLIHDQLDVSASLNRVCTDFLEKVVGELSEIEDSKVEGKIDLDYCKIVSFGSFEVEVLYLKRKYVCTVDSSFSDPQKFYTKDIDRVESFLSNLKKQYTNTMKNVLEEELSKFG